MIIAITCGNCGWNGTQEDLKDIDDHVCPECDEYDLEVDISKSEFRSCPWEHTHTKREQYTKAGKIEIWLNNNNEFEAYCSGCLATAPVGESELAVALRWNNRVGPATAACC